MLLTLIYVEIDVRFKQNVTDILETLANYHHRLFYRGRRTKLGG